MMGLLWSECSCSEKPRDTSVSSRPGLRIAGSSASGLLVVAITTSPLIWSAWSKSVRSCAEARAWCGVNPPTPLLGHRLSTSSNNKTQTPVKEERAVYLTAESLPLQSEILYFVSTSNLKNLLEIKCFNCNYLNFTLSISDGFSSECFHWNGDTTKL